MESNITEPGDVADTLAQLSAGSDKVCVLDQLHLPYAHRGGGPAAKFGLGVELFLPNRDRAQCGDKRSSCFSTSGIHFRIASMPICGATRSVPSASRVVLNR